MNIDKYSLEKQQAKTANLALWINSQSSAVGLKILEMFFVQFYFWKQGTNKHIELNFTFNWKNRRTRNKRGKPIDVARKANQQKKTPEKQLPAPCSARLLLTIMFSIAVSVVSSILEIF